MPSSQPKTLAPLLIMQILEEYSDEDHPLTREEIERLLDEKYGITMERKAFFRHMENLIQLKKADDEYGKIVRTTVTIKRPEEVTYAAFYLTERKLNDHELRIIIDALAGSPYLSQKDTQELTEYLASLSSRYFQKKMETYPFIGQGAKTGNKKVSHCLEVINEAIAENKQISFDILSINSRGEQEVSNRPKEVCTPIRYFVKDHNYYLVAVKTVEAELLKSKSFGFKEGDLHLEAYVLSDVANVEKLNLPAHDYRSLPEFRHGIDWQKLLREHPSMKLLWYKPELCTFLCARDKIEAIKTHFGGDLRIRSLSNTEFEKASKITNIKIARDALVEVSVITDRYEAALFALSCPFGLWVVSPKPARAIVRSLSVSLLERYDQLEQHYITGKKLPPLNLSYTPVNAPQEDA